MKNIDTKLQYVDGDTTKGELRVYNKVKFFEYKYLAAMIALMKEYDEAGKNINVSRLDVSAALGISSGTIWKWQTGLLLPSYPTLVAWGVFLGFSVDKIHNYLATADVSDFKSKSCRLFVRPEINFR